MFRSHVKALLATLVISFLFGCSTPEEASIKAFKKNESQFIAMIPQWSKLVPPEYKKHPPANSSGYIQGKMVVIYMGPADWYYAGTRSSTEYELAQENEDEKLHRLGLIAHSPSEVGTVVIVEGYTADSASYGEGGSTRAFFYKYGYNVYVFDMGTRETVDFRRLVPNASLPEKVRETGSVAPHQELHNYLTSLPRR